MALVRLAVDSDLHDLEGRLRHADMVELEAHGVDATEVLKVGIMDSKPCYAIEHQGRCIALFGVTRVFGAPRFGNVWLLGTDEITEIRTQFLRQSRGWLERISEGYDLLSNVVHEDNELHHKWLRFLGFQFVRREPPFIEFARIS